MEKLVLTKVELEQNTGQDRGMMIGTVNDGGWSATYRCEEKKGRTRPGLG
jgi:hypothetical protein